MGDTVSSLLKSRGSEKVKAKGETQEWHFEYSTVKEFFLQDSPLTTPGLFDAMKENFGLIEQEYDTDKLLPANGKDLTQWQRFGHKLKIMNERATKDVSYRLLYLGRHGQGYHNVAAKFYGDNAWDCYYSTLHNDPHIPSIQYFDASLTPLGKQQVQETSQFWHTLLTTHHTPPPQSYYSSPHTRALQTALLTFCSLPLPHTHPFRPKVKELLREGHGIHTCDSRSSKSHLQTHFPEFEIEKSFTESDELYSPTRREPPWAHTARMRRLLDDVFATDDNTYISMTSHHGTIAATLTAVGHRAFSVPTGGVIPVLVQVRKVAGKREGDDDDGVDDREDWEVKPDCEGDPLKAGLEGYKDIGEYLEEIERGLGGFDEVVADGKVKGKGKERALN